MKKNSHALRPISIKFHGNGCLGTLYESGLNGFALMIKIAARPKNKNIYVNDNTEIHKMVPIQRTRWRHELKIEKSFLGECLSTLRPIITKTRLYYFDPIKPHFYIVKLGFTRVHIIFLISAQKHKLWVLTMYVLSRNMKNISICYLIFFF